jgi:Domain of unknown function (DUF4350)
VRISGRGWAMVALVVAIGILLVLRGSSTADAPEHRTDSDASNGTSALPQLATALGRRTSTLQDRLDLGPGLDELFVFTPTRGFSPDEARRLSSWVRGGGVLVYAAEDGDFAVDYALGVRRRPLPVSGDVSGGGPMLAGVSHVSGGTAVRPLVLDPSGVGLLRGANGAVTGYEELVGRGRLVVLADPLPLCNGFLQRADNWRLASDLISLAPSAGEVGFDEYHHAQSPVGPDSPLTGLLSTSWGVGISWAVALVFTGLLLRGRAFGPRLRLSGAGERSSAEHVTAVGRLLERARATGMTGQLLAAATRRSLAARHGLRGAGAGLDAALAGRAPADAAELAGAEAELRANPGQAGLVAAAGRLHRLAYPDVGLAPPHVGLTPQSSEEKRA